MRAPDFWARPGGLSTLLAPAGAAWAAAAAMRRSWSQPWQAPVPVICIGNINTGGAGKTPLALTLGAYLKQAGRAPHFISRGYGGSLEGPVAVDPARHDAADVGDEPLLLAEIAPTWIARDRKAAAQAAVAAGADIIVMDDGLQNFTLVKDVSVIAIDGGYGFGNGRVMPAGPLREPLDSGLARADAAVLIGPDETGCANRASRSIPVFAARMVPLPGPSHDEIAGKTVVAFAGIARPAKFYATLAEIGCTLAATRDFADHHCYRPDEIMAICEQAAALGALPVTTAKDAARLPPPARSMVKILHVGL
ncbi:MAG: tetraacyldisaccharide 4'-kinase, partial [Alphaproteobacteria bacterium]